MDHSVIDSRSIVPNYDCDISFLQFPAEVHLHILKNVDYPALNALSKTCKKMYAICSDNSIWKALYVRDLGKPCLSSYRFFQQNSANWKVLFQTTFRIHHQYYKQIDIVHKPDKEIFPSEEEIPFIDLNCENDKLVGLTPDDHILVWNSDDGTLGYSNEWENRPLVSYQNDWLIYKELHRKDEKKCSLKMRKLSEYLASDAAPSLTLRQSIDTNERIFVSEKWAYCSLEHSRKIYFFSLVNPSMKFIIPFPKDIESINEIKCINESAMLFLPNNRIYFIPSIVTSAGFFVAPRIVPNINNCHLEGDSLILLSSFLHMEIWSAKDQTCQGCMDLRKGFPPESFMIGKVIASQVMDGKLALGTMHGYVMVIDLESLCVESAWNTKFDLSHILLMGDICLTTDKKGPLRFWEWKHPDRGCKQREIHPIDEFYLLECFKIHDLSFDGRRLYVSTSDGYITILDYLPQQIMESKIQKDEMRGIASVSVLKRSSSQELTSSSSPKRSRKNKGIPLPRL